MTLNDYISSVKDKRICVIGIGVSNKPLIDKLLSEGCDVTVCDKRSAVELGEDFTRLLPSAQNSPSAKTISVTLIMI